MRASAEPEPTVVVGRRRRLPRPVVWLLWLLAALVGSVVVGFLAGLARPREPDPWAAPTASPEPPQTPPAESPPAAAVIVPESSDSEPPSAKDD